MGWGLWWRVAQSSVFFLRFPSSAVHAGQTAPIAGLQVETGCKDYSAIHCMIGTCVQLSNPQKMRKYL
eukprot:1984339-Amphidinium_carterae.1